MKKIKIATRKSPLAVWQAEYVKRELIKEHSDIEVELLCMQTEGDRFLESRLINVGGKGLFIKELEDALLCNDADIAVHSMKDVVVDLPESLMLPVIMEREDSRDVLISNSYNKISEIADNAIVGTSSLRRQSQIKKICPNVALKDLRGNVETRIRKLDDGEYDAILLAAAGLIRLGLSDRITQLVPHSVLLPAIGQGAIGIECRSGDTFVQKLIMPLNDENTSLCVSAERVFSRRLYGGCELPIAAHASIEGNEINLSGLVANPDGSKIIKSSQKGNLDDIENIGNSLAEFLLLHGADSILKTLKYS